MTAYQSPDAFTPANGSGATVRAAIGVDLQAAALWSEGASAPSAPYPGQPWHDLTTNTLKARNQANSAWIVLGKFDETTGAFVSLLGGPEQAIASATTTDLGSVAEQVVAISGTTAITGFGSSASTASPIYFLRFLGALTLTYNATSLILPGAANIATAAGDTAIAQYLGSGNWRVIDYQRANGTPLVPIADGSLLANTSGGAAGAVATTLSTLLDYLFGNTQGKLLERGATAWQAIGPGTSGQVLTSNGASADPSFQTSGVSTTYSALYTYTIKTSSTLNAWAAGSTYSLSGLSGTWRCMGSAVAEYVGCCLTPAGTVANFVRIS